MKNIKKADVTVMQDTEHTGRVVVVVQWNDEYQTQVLMYDKDGELLPDDQTQPMNLGSATPTMVKEMLEEDFDVKFEIKRY